MKVAQQNTWLAIQIRDRNQSRVLVASPQNGSRLCAFPFFTIRAVIVAPQILKFKPSGDGRKSGFTEKHADFDGRLFHAVMLPVSNHESSRECIYLGKRVRCETPH